MTCGRRCLETCTKTPLCRWTDPYFHMNSNTIDGSPISVFSLMVPLMLMVFLGVLDLRSLCGRCLLDRSCSNT